MTTDITLKGKRILLKPYIKDDAKAFYHLLKKNEKKLWLGFPFLLSTCKDKESTAQFLEFQSQQWLDKTKFAFGIFLPKQNELIGHIFAKNFDWRVPKCELGYLIDHRHSQKGYTTEAMELLIQYCFEQLKMIKLFLRISPENIGSIRVAEKSGFEFEATLKKDFRTFDDQLIDVNYYSRFLNNSL